MPDPAPLVPRRRFATVHGYDRAYLDHGDGPVLLLLHGIGDNADSWERVLGDLARDHRVIVPDLLGHGRSAKPRADYSVAAFANGMRDLLTVLDVERATIVGHSLGGGVAAQFAYQYPERPPGPDHRRPLRRRRRRRRARHRHRFPGCRRPRRRVNEADARIGPATGGCRRAVRRARGGAPRRGR